MKLIFCTLALSITTLLSAQTIINGNSVLLRPEFELGDRRVYYVKDEYKIESSPLFPVNAVHEYEISFTVLDTTDGYELAYTSKTLSSKNNNWPLESIKASIGSGLYLRFKIKKSGILDKIYNPEQIQSKLSDKLDSLIKNKPLSGRETAMIAMLQDTLKNKRSVELFIKPLVLFLSAFSKPAFYPHKTFHHSNRVNILNEKGLPGVLVTKLKKRSKGTLQFTLDAEFIGNRDSAAYYYVPVLLNTYESLTGKDYKNPRNLPSEMKNNYEVSYLTNVDDWQLQEINYRSIEFFVKKLTSKTIMALKEPSEDD